MPSILAIIDHHKATSAKYSCRLTITDIFERAHERKKIKENAILCQLLKEYEDPFMGLILHFELSVLTYQKEGHVHA